jgi:hypothetical protein
MTPSITHPTVILRLGEMKYSIFNGKLQQKGEEFAQLKENVQPPTRANGNCLPLHQLNEVPSSISAS